MVNIQYSLLSKSAESNKVQNEICLFPAFITTLCLFLAMIVLCLCVYMSIMFCLFIGGKPGSTLSTFVLHKGSGKSLYGKKRSDKSVFVKNNGDFLFLP